MFTSVHILRFPGATADLTKHAGLVADVLSLTNYSYVVKNRKDETLGYLFEKAMKILRKAIDGEEVSEPALHAAEIVLRNIDNIR